MASSGTLSDWLAWAPDPAGDPTPLPGWARQLVDLGTCLAKADPATTPWRVVVDSPSALFAAPLITAGFTSARFTAAVAEGRVGPLAPEDAVNTPAGESLVLAVRADKVIPCTFRRVEENQGAPYLVVHDDAAAMDRAFPLAECGRFWRAAHGIRAATLPVGGLAAAFGPDLLIPFHVAGSAEAVLVGSSERLRSELASPGFAVLCESGAGVGPLDALVLSGAAAGVHGAHRTRLASARDASATRADGVRLIVVEGAAASLRALPSASRDTHQVVIVGSSCADLTSTAVIDDFNARFLDRIDDDESDLTGLVNGPLDVLAFREESW